MKRRATTTHTGGEKGVSQKAVKQALEMKRAGPYLIGKYLYFFLRSHVNSRALHVFEQTQCELLLPLGPRIGSSPVRSIVQCLARKEGTDDFYILKVRMIYQCELFPSLVQ